MWAGGCLPPMVGNGLRARLKAVFLNFFFRYFSSQGMFSGVGANGILSGRDGMVLESTHSLVLSVSPLRDATTVEYQSIGYGKVSGRIFVSVKAFRLKYSLSTLSQMYNGCRVT